MSNRNIRWGNVKRTSNDAGPYKLVTVECDGTELECQVLDLSGVEHSPMEGGQAMVFLPDGDEGKAVAVIMAPPKDRVDGQKPGMVTLKNHSKGQSVVLDNDGNVIIKSTGIVHINPPE